MDSDRVLVCVTFNLAYESCIAQVLQSGRIAEFDKPYLLLQNKSSYFSALVAQTGAKESEKLIEMARKHYLSIRRNKFTVVYNYKIVTQSDKIGLIAMCSLNNVYFCFCISYNDSVSFIKISIHFCISDEKVK